MNHQINPSFFIFICLYKMISSTKRPKRLFGAVKIDFSRFQTSKFCQIYFFIITMRKFSDTKTGRDFFINEFIQLFQLNMFIFHTDCLHSTSNIHTYQIWHHTFLDCHSGSNGTSGPRMYVRHNSDFGILCKLLVA